MTDNTSGRDPLDERLRDVARHLAVPPVPAELADDVLSRLEAPAAAQGLPYRHRLLAVAAAVAVLVGAIAVTAVPGARHAVAGWFDFNGVDITPAPSPTGSGLLPSGTAPPAPDDLALGRRTTLSALRSTAGFIVRLPTGLGLPAAVYEQHDRGATIVSVVYPPTDRLPASAAGRAGLILTEIHTDGRTLLRKILETGAQATAVRVGGHAGVYIAGPQEVIMTLGDGGTSGDVPILEAPPRLSANSLIWQVGDITYRIEASVPRVLAVQIGANISAS